MSDENHSINVREMILECNLILYTQTHTYTDTIHRHKWITHFMMYIYSGQSSSMYNLKVSNDHQLLMNEVYVLHTKEVMLIWCEEMWCDQRSEVLMKNELKNKTLIGGKEKLKKVLGH